MPYRSIRTLESWVREFEQIGRDTRSSIRVIPQDGAEGADTGLVALRLPKSPTEICIEPPGDGQPEWTVLFEPRDEAVQLVASDVQMLSAEMATLAALCAFLQQKSDAFLRGGNGEAGWPHDS